ncbi:hypothetical protein K7X08_021570 [Anisodus acutangulus]|uniref:Uncharacterized protein n=1 Tax=Anisodus acutangulus TaxID=402998 RepID=A0A9Q1M5N5_9SOLA|nr:hypothetical protein K7X08_021570 [Anisodus acutangulus]
MTKKIRYSEEVDEAVTGKDVDNVKRKGKKKVTADGSDDENVKKKRKSAVESQDIPCESIFETGPETVPATPNDVDDTKTKLVDMTYFDLVESGEECFPIEDERLLLDLEGLAFELVPESSHSQRMSDGFFCTQAPKVDMGQSSRGDDESSNVDMKKELESFRVHVDSKFGEILQAIVDLNKKDEKENAFAYSSGLHTDCADLDMDDNQGNESQSDFACISMSQSAIAAITQKYHTDKKSENEKGENKVITQAAKVSVASTEVVGDEQSIKDDCPENTTINAVVTEEARGDVLPQGGDVESADAGNESVDSELTKGSESVLAPPPENVELPQAIS